MPEEPEDSVLDALLAAELKPPRVPPHFRERLHRRIELERRHERMARLPILLDFAGSAAVAAAVGVTLHLLVPFPKQLTPQAGLAVAWMSASACAAASLWGLWFCRERPGYR